MPAARFLRTNTNQKSENCNGRIESQPRNLRVKPMTTRCDDMDTENGDMTKPNEPAFPAKHPLRYGRAIAAAVNGEAVLVVTTRSERDVFNELHSELLQVLGKNKHIRFPISLGFDLPTGGKIFIENTTKKLFVDDAGILVVEEAATRKEN